MIKYDKIKDLFLIKHNLIIVLCLLSCVGLGISFGNIFLSTKATSIVNGIRKETVTDPMEIKTNLKKTDSKEHYIKMNLSISTTDEITSKNIKNKEIQGRLKEEYMRFFNSLSYDEMSNTNNYEQIKNQLVQQIENNLHYKIDNVFFLETTVE